MFWKYGEPAHSSQRCGVSASCLRNWRTRRDLPMPASPEINTTCPSPVACAFPATPQKPRFIVTSNKRRKTVYHRRSQTISHTAQPHDSVQLDRFGDSLKLMSAALLYHEQTRNQPINGRSDNHRIRIGRRLHSRSDVGSIAEDFRLRCRHPSPITTLPVSIPTRTESFGRSLFPSRCLARPPPSSIASPARAARSASLSCASGHPKYAMMPSPRYFAT